MTALVRCVHGTIVGVWVLVAVITVPDPLWALALLLIGPVAAMPWLFMPLLERALMWLQEHRS